MGKEVGEHDVEVISPSCSNRSSGSGHSKKSYLTSTPIKKDPYAQNDDVIIVDYIPSLSAQKHINVTERYLSSSKKEMSFGRLSNKSTVEQCFKLKRELKRCYRRMTFRVEEMILDNSKSQENSETEYKLRRRSSSRSRRSKGNASPDHTTPVRRSSRLLKAKSDGKMLIDENNNGIKEDDKHVEQTMSSSFIHTPLDITVRMKHWVRSHPFIDFTAPFIIFAIFAVLLFFILNHFITEDIRSNMINHVHIFGRRAFSKIQALMK